MHSTLRVAVAASIALVAIATCKTDEDCSLNGVCRDGACDCDPAWTESDCGMLALLPAAQKASFHGLNEQTTSWGGSVVPAKGKYYMYAAEMMNNCTLGSWTVNSEVVVATSDKPEGPYVEQRQIVKPWAHNPQAIVVDGGKTVAVFSLGDGVPINGPVKDCTKGTAAPVPPRSQPRPRPAVRSKDDGNTTVHFVIHFAENDFVNGPWRAWNASIVDFPTEYKFPGNWNPSPWLMSDGKTVRLMVHTNTAPWAGEVVVEADNWRGPYRPITRDITDCTHCQEDPFMYQDKRDNWHVLYHRMFDPNGTSPIPSPGWAGGHSFSRDGLKWSNIRRAYNTSVQFTDGTSAELKRRERPKLIFAEDGRTPKYLSNGVQGPLDTYTLIVPIRTAK